MKKIFDDIKSARWAIIMIIAYFAILRKYIYTICPVVLLTGFPCPGCGMTRAAMCILRMDFAGAWHMHPFIYPIIVLAIWLVYIRYFAHNGNMKKWFTSVVIVAVAMIIFYVWRMKMYFPGEAPMSYYYGSILGKIRRILEMY